MRRIGKWLRDNSLSLAFFALFVLCFAGEAVTGHFLARLKRPHGTPASLLDFIGGAEFLKGTFGNWQAALLQLFVLIVFAVFLRQRGASHSRAPDGPPKPPPSPKGLVRRGGTWLYRNSLSIAFGVLFAAAFVAFVVADRAASQPERAQLGLPPFGFLEFLVSARLWFDVFQTWQAEFLVMGLFLVLSIGLRQENSAESKPVWATDDDTGETNH